MHRSYGLLRLRGSRLAWLDRIGPPRRECTCEVSLTIVLFQLSGYRIAVAGVAVVRGGGGTRLRTIRMDETYLRVDGSATFWLILCGHRHINVRDSRRTPLHSCSGPQQGTVLRRLWQ